MPAFNMVTGLLTSNHLDTTKIEPYRVLVLSGLESVKVCYHEGLLIVICIRYLVVSNPLAVWSTRS